MVNTLKGSVLFDKLECLVVKLNKQRDVTIIIMVGIYGDRYTLTNIPAKTITLLTNLCNVYIPIEQIIQLSGRKQDIYPNFVR